jgi:hypothetical protein
MLGISRVTGNGQGLLVPGLKFRVSGLWKQAEFIPPYFVTTLY